MKILVTGAAGFIGSHLSRFLIEQEGVEKVRLLVSPKDSLEKLPTDLPLDVVVADIRDKKKVQKAMEGVDTVYHLAAVTLNGEGGEFMSVNFGGTKVLVDACKGRRIKKFVYFSTIAVYGLPAYIGSREGINENSLKNVVDEYGRSKDAADKLIEAAHNSWGLPYAILRPTTVYGPYDKAGIYQLYKAIKGKYFVRIGNGKNKVDYVYVEDIVKGARLAEKSPRKAGDYILGAPSALPFKKIINIASKEAGAKIPRFYISRWIALILVNIFSLITKQLNLKLPISVNRVKVMTATFAFDIRKARRELGYNPLVDFSEGMRRTANWIENKDAKK